MIAGLGEVLIHGVAIKPGKPAIIGRIDKKPIIGMPGYPLSALTVLREIVHTRCCYYVISWAACLRHVLCNCDNLFLFLLYGFSLQL